MLSGRPRPLCCSSCSAVCPAIHGISTFFLLFVVPVWLVFSCIILYRWLVNHVLWKVRNRLVVTYLLMGLAPVVLFVTLATIAAYVFSGQFATFAATSELDKLLERLSAENQAFAVHTAHSIARSPSVSSVELADYEGANQNFPGRLVVNAWTDQRRIELIADGRALPQHNDQDPSRIPPGRATAFAVSSSMTASLPSRREHQDRRRSPGRLRLQRTPQPRNCHSACAGSRAHSHHSRRQQVPAG